MGLFCLAGHDTLQTLVHYIMMGKAYRGVPMLYDKLAIFDYD